MGETHLQATAAPISVEGTSVPVLPARDIPETLALFERLDFTVRYDETNEYAMVCLGKIELHFTASPNLDPWETGGPALHSCASTMPPHFMRSSGHGACCRSSVAASELRAAERARDELRRKWDAGESIARMGEIADEPWGIREFPILDCNNNLIRFGQVLGEASAVSDPHE
jgi:hypothetical protein